MQPKLRALPLLAVALVAGHARAEAAVRPEAKIAPWVMEKTAAGGAAEFLVVLAPQADLAGARALPTKQAKGRFVRDALWDMAQATQGPLLAELRAGGVEHRAYYIVNMVWVKGDRALALALAARSDVARIEGNPVIHNVLPEPEGPVAGPEVPDAPETGINFVRAPQVWALGFTGQGVVVGGQDTGYRWTHNALKPHYRGWNGTTADHDFNWHDSIHSGGGICGANSPVPCDDYFHGSHTMGTTVGDDGAGNQVGMAPGAKWIGCRNMDVGAGTPATYLECFEFFLAPYPVGQGPGQGDPALAPDVTVNSWTCPPGEGCAAGTLLAAVQTQRAAGIVTEASAGNAGPGCSTVTDPPAIYDESFSTGALNTGLDTLADFSSWGPVAVDGSGRVKPDITAPGTGTRSCDNTADNAYTTASGTSMAGPHVAGAVALLLSAVPSLSGNPDAIEQRLTDTAVRNATNSTGLCSSTAGVYPNNLWGYGRLDVLCAVHGNLSGVSISVAGSTSVCPTCTGGTATVTDTGGGPATHQWGFRTTSGGAITNIPGQTGISYVINGADFPGAGSYLLVERTTSTASCGAPLVSNEVPVTVTPVALSIGDVTVAEGNAGGTTASFSVTLSGPSGAVSVDYATADGTASVADGDYAAASGTLTFAPGQTAQPLSVTVNGDTRFEANETFLVDLSNPQAAALADGQGLGTIVNDDTATAADSRIELVHASRLLRSLGAVGSVAYDDYFRIREGARSSYEVVLDAATGDIGASGPALERIASDGSTVVQSSVAAGAGASRSLGFENASSTALDEYVRVRSLGCGANCGSEDVYALRAYETTLAVARFNNSGTQITVLVVQNTSDRTIGGSIWFRDSTGAVAGTAALSLGPRATQTLNTSTVVSGVSGTITISHDGRYGDLAGKAVAVEPATGFTFDTALLSRTR